MFDAVKERGDFDALIVVGNLSATTSSVRRSQQTHALHTVMDLSFETFAVTALPRLRQALIARYGMDVGADSFAAATAWAWENWERLQGIENKVAYLYRVAQSSQRSTRMWQKRTTTRFPNESSSPDCTASVDLGILVSALPDKQRICVLLVHAHNWTYAEVAALLNMRVDAVNNHVHRGTLRLRKLVKEEP